MAQVIPLCSACILRCTMIDYLCNVNDGSPDRSANAISTLKLWISYLSKSLAALSMLYSQNTGLDAGENMLHVLRQCQDMLKALDEELCRATAREDAVLSIFSGWVLRFRLSDVDFNVLTSLVQVYKMLVDVMSVTILSCWSRNSSSFLSPDKLYHEYHRRGQSQVETIKQMLQRHRQAEHTQTCLLDVIYGPGWNFDRDIVPPMEFLIRQTKETFIRGASNISARRQKSSPNFRNVSSSGIAVYTENKGDLLRDHSSRNREKPIYFGNSNLKATKAKSAEEAGLQAHEKKNYDKAEELLRKCLDYRIDLDGEDISGVQFTKSMNDLRSILATIYSDRKQWNEVINVMEPALSSPTLDEKYKLDARYLLAKVYYEKGVLVEADDKCALALEQSREANGKEDAIFCESAALLKSIYKAQGRQEDIPILDDYVVKYEKDSFTALIKDVTELYQKHSIPRVEQITFSWLDRRVGTINLDVDPQSKPYTLWGPLKNTWRTELKLSLGQSFNSAFLGKGASCSLLHILAALDNSALIEHLIDKEGAVVDCTTRHYGFTPLAIAVHFYSYRAARALINRGAAINNKYEISLLNWASNRSTMLDLLLSASKSNLNETLRSAVGSEGCSRLVEALLERGADIETKFKDGSTPLLRACQKPSREDIVAVLLKKGANVNASIRGKVGQNSWTDMTPLTFAVKGNRPEYAQLLLEHNPALPLYYIKKPWKVDSNHAYQLVRETYCRETASG
ncbi:hypothetical protein BGW36DRAFT_432793 [Talaromyces proteolyticus]|uniref:Uncharacterized protein n=1 Tax=Talaromyces proteolyticus TaxID=1131652 RepID=A0AAD4KDR9_9EURO|nr:uncharacterized protein BGW36DRAFT_432793 [Talaromyces proteolyticus]KAH8689822.1 hypothetical protein BGW36DRAFT_432793 [Talaromyces proteolyticus]